MSHLVIKTDNLTKRYGDVVALDGLNLAVPRHSIFGFLGPNGAGKTTTMKLLLGLTRPTQGGGAIFGRDIVTDNLAIRARIGYLPQQPAFYKEMTAREALRFTASFFYEGPKTRLEARIDETLALVGLSGKADRTVHGFSGGERQRLGIAQAQINHPDLLILDEPAAALDPLGRRDVLSIMERLREVSTIFYSTHILDDVQQVSDTVAILDKGRLVSQGPIATLLNGDGQTSYTVTFKGRIAPARDLLKSQSWVTQVHPLPHNGAAPDVARWEIVVSDDAVAEQQLFRLLARQDDLFVLEYGRKSVELEEIFMQLVEGENR